MMKILCCMLILLQGTLGAPFPERKRKTMKPFLGGFITENSGRSTEFKYEKAEDEFPRNQEQTQITPVHEDGYDSLAFHAYLSSSQNYTASTIIKFDTAPVNVLNRYNPSTGKYIVGLLGVYAFTWTVAADRKTYFTTELMVNDAVKGNIKSDADFVGQSDGIHPSTGFVLAIVEPRDEVWIRYHKYQGNTILSDNTTRSTFSGWRIR